jgi:hypothetical protein
MFSDGVIDLVEKGAITNAFKTIQTGKIVSSFALGTKRLYDFLDDNSFVGKYKLEQWGQHSFASCSSMVKAFIMAPFSTRSITPSLNISVCIPRFLWWASLSKTALGNDPIPENLCKHQLAM